MVSLKNPTVLFHHGQFQSVWEQPNLIQAGPNIENSSNSVNVGTANVSVLKSEIIRSGFSARSVLINYTDPFIIRASPLRELKKWIGPKLLVCGDLHHGYHPLDVLQAYLEVEPHDAVLIAFNPVLLKTVRERLTVPVRSLPPTFFRYHSKTRATNTKLELLHVGSLGMHHRRRYELIMELQARGRIPMKHITTKNSEEAASLYSQHALVLNIPLNNDLNHRFFEIMAAGSPQIVFGDANLTGEHGYLSERPDIFWCSTIEQLEETVLQLFSNPNHLLSIQVEPPCYWELKNLLKIALAP